MCLKSCAVMCPSVVSELVAEGQQAINTSVLHLRGQLKLAGTFI